MLDPSERSEINDFRERLAKSEANITNNEKNLQAYKEHTEKQFQTLGDKIDQLTDLVSGIQTTLAKWIGGGAVLMFIGNIAIDHFFK